MTVITTIASAAGLRAPAPRAGLRRDQPLKHGGAQGLSGRRGAAALPEWLGRCCLRPSLVKEKCEAVFPPNCRIAASPNLRIADSPHHQIAGNLLDEALSVLLYQAQISVEVNNCTNISASSLVSLLRR